VGSAPQDGDRNERQVVQQYAQAGVVTCLRFPFTFGGAPRMDIAKQKARIPVKANRSPLWHGNVLLVLAIGLIVAGASVLFKPTTPAATTAPVVSDPAAVLLMGVPNSSGYADRLIARAQERIKLEPGDYKAFSDLGLAYLQKARETNDPAFYTQAEGVLKKSLAIQPDNYDALGGLGALNLSRHQFRNAMDWGMKAQRLNPQKSYAYGVVGDAEIELGEYDQAVDTFQKMVDLRPDLSSYSRVSYARELYGDVPGATQAMQQAVNAGGPAAENTAWARVQLGNLYFNNNQLDKAEKQYSDALRGYPGYLYGLAGMAQVRWAQGQKDEGLKLMKQAVDIVPLPQYLTALGDMYSAVGNSAAAKEQYDLVLYIYRVFEANGVNVGVEKAAFLADYEVDIDQAVKLAEAAAAERQDVHTQDTLAWVLFKAGRYPDALAVDQSAMRLGTQNALFYFHDGMIYSNLGESANARQSLQKALDINPNFSVRYAQQAAYALKSLSK
jgi:tetratricopeptide (TPR) repeat protein